MEDIYTKAMPFIWFIVLGFYYQFVVVSILIQSFKNRPIKEGIIIAVFAPYAIPLLLLQKKLIPCVNCGSYNMEESVYCCSCSKHPRIFGL